MLGDTSLAVLGAVAPPDIPWLLVRLSLLVFLSGYFLFSLVVTRQVHLLNQGLGTSLSPLLKLIAVLHAIVSLLVLVVAFLS